MEHKIVNGISIPLTEAEISARLVDEATWSEGAFDRSMADLRQKRNALLSSTDYLALSDNTLSSTTATYRQSLRDITEGLTTKDEVEAVVFPTKE